MFAIVAVFARVAWIATSTCAALVRLHGAASCDFCSAIRKREKRAGDEYGSHEHDCFHTASHTRFARFREGQTLTRSVDWRHNVSNDMLSSSVFKLLFQQSLQAFVDLGRE